MIAKLVIENFKSIKKIDIELKNINILIGSNGAGKSNFISFFKLLNAITQKKLQYYVGEESGANNILHYGLKYSEYLKGKIELKNTESFSQYNFTLNANTEGSLFISNEDSSYGDIGEFSKSKVDSMSVGITSDETMIIKELDENKKNLNSISLKKLSEYKVYHFHDTSKTARVKQSFNLYDNETLYEDARNLASFLYKLKETNGIALKKIEKTIKLIAPYFGEFILKPNPLNPEEIRLAWKEKNNEDMIFNASHFSDGTLRMICLITLFMQPTPPQVIILDEPELGLHPFALTILSDLIKKVADSGIQVIISTQSVPLIDKFSIEDIIVVEKGNSGSEFKRLHEEELKEWLEDYTIGELWEKNLLGGRP